MDEEEQREPMSPILKYILIGGVILLLIISFVVYAVRAGHPAARIVNGTTVSKNVECKLKNRLPDPICTPGQMLPTPKLALCSENYPLTMPIDDSVELDVYRRYGIGGGNWTIEFLMPVALGGGNGEDNLYPMSNDYPGYVERDKATQTLREQVCNQGMPIEVAQDIILNSWWTKPALYQ